MGSSFELWWNCNKRELRWNGSCLRTCLVRVRSDWNPKSSSESKVSQLHRPAVRDEQILRLEVSVEHAVRVAECNAGQQLVQKALRVKNKRQRRRT